MKTCENCKKVFQDDMNYCPYCGTKVHDYKDDLKEAMNELFEEISEDKIEKPVYSRVKNKEIINKKKTNDSLNKFLVIILVSIIGVMLVGAVKIGEKLFPSQPGIVEDTNPTNDDKTDIDQNDTNVENNTQSDGQVIDVSNIEEGDFYIQEIKVNMEDDQVRINVNCHALVEGNVYLKDESSLNIGPIDIKEGNNQYYFLVNGQTNYKLVFNASNEKSYEYSITKNMLDEALSNN